MTWIKIISAGLFVASLLILGWKAASWHHDSNLLKAARLELRNEVERRVKADADRLALQVKLSDAEARIGTGVRIVTKTIKQYVQPNDLCNLSEPVAGQLQQLRRGVPPAPTKLVGAGAATGK
jgi:hypothetical protein